jgi:hypothetical protein
MTCFHTKTFEIQHFFPKNDYLDIMIGLGIMAKIEFSWIIKKMSDQNNNDNEKAKKPRPPATIDEMTPEVMRDIFKRASDKVLDRMKDYIPGVKKISSLITKLHDTGALYEIGLEVATFDNLRELNLMTRQLTGGQPYCLLRIQDSCFVLRINKDSILDLHIENQNYARPHVTSLDEHQFWNSETSHRYFSYDLKIEKDCVALMEDIVKSAGTRSASRSFESYNVEPKNRGTLNSKRSLS